MEVLAEVEEDKSLMSKENAELSAEIARLTTELEQSKSMLEEIQESNQGFGRAFDKFNVEGARYVRELTVAGGILCELDHEKAAMQNSLDKLSRENASLRQQVATANEEIKQIMSTEPPTLDEGLLTERTSLQNDLYKANGKLDQIRAFLGPSPVSLLPNWQPWGCAYAGNYVSMPMLSHEEVWSPGYACSQDENLESKIWSDARPSARSTCSETADSVQVNLSTG